MPHMLFDDTGKCFGDGDRAAIVYEIAGERRGVISPVVWLVDRTGIRSGLPHDMCVYPVLQFIQDVHDRKRDGQNIKIISVNKI